VGAIMMNRKGKKAARRDATPEDIPNGISIFRGTPPEYDPVNADPDDFHLYGIPPKPPQSTQPERFKFWLKMFSGTWKFVKPKFQRPHVATKYGPRATPGTRHPASLNWSGGGYITSPAIPGTRYEASLNWSGRYITPQQGRRFTQLHAQWQVPTAQPPAHIPAQGEYRSAAWIGFDGQRRYRASSLPQIGTAQRVEVSNGQPLPPIMSAWCQWWVRDRSDNAPFTLSSLKIHANDIVICSLVAKGGRKVAFYIRNVTTRHAFPVFEWNAPSDPLRRPVTVSGATAEWIVERPMILGTDTPYELSDYKLCLFEDCHAVSACAGEQDHTENLRHAKLIKMYETTENPHRAVRVSSAKLKDDQTVEVRYG
jgi:Peptidase A4 family